MHARAALLLVALLCACTTAQPPLDLRSAELIDLTWPFDEQTLYWPSSASGFQMQRLAHGPTPGGWFYSANAICTAEHGGTHLDAPIHFAANGTTADEIPLRNLIGPAIVIDITAQAADDPDYRLTAGDVHAWESRHGRIEPGSIVLLRTGWSARWPDRKSYFGDDTPGA